MIRLLRLLKISCLRFIEQRNNSLPPMDVLFLLIKYETYFFMQNAWNVASALGLAGTLFPRAQFGAVLIDSRNMRTDKPSVDDLRRVHTHVIGHRQRSWRQLSSFDIDRCATAWVWTHLYRSVSVSKITTCSCKNVWILPQGIKLPFDIDRCVPLLWCISVKKLSTYFL